MSKDKEFQDWLSRAAKGSGEKLAESAMYAGIVTTDFMKDPLCALQLGLAILMDKPIILIADKAVKIPESLVKIAKVIERVDMNDKQDSSRAAQAIADFSRTL